MHERLEVGRADAVVECPGRLWMGGGAPQYSSFRQSLLIGRLWKGWGRPAGPRPRGMGDTVQWSACARGDRPGQWRMIPLKGAGHRKASTREWTGAPVQGQKRSGWASLPEAVAASG